MPVYEWLQSGCVVSMAREDPGRPVRPTGTATLYYRPTPQLVPKSDVDGVSAILHAALAHGM